MDCCLRLQIPVPSHAGTVMCVYPTPLDRDLLEDLDVPEHDDARDEDPQCQE